jgi:hypothetical protein
MLITESETIHPELTLVGMVRGWWQRKPSTRRQIYLAANMLLCRDCEWRAVDWGSLVESDQLPEVPQRGALG